MQYSIHRALCINILVSLACILLCFDNTYCEIPSSVENNSLLELETEGTHLKASYAGMPIIVSMLDDFEVFGYHANLTRKRLINGPWHGNTSPRFIKHSAGAYTVYGQQPSSQFSYEINYIKISSNEIIIDFLFTAPDSGFPTAIEFEIARLAGEVFRGAIIETTPRSGKAVAYLPMDPLPEDKRFITSDRSQVVFRTAFCDVVIKDRSRKNSISMVDSRAVSWASKKSFLLYVKKPVLIPGERYQFSYSIQFLPPSGHAKRQSVIELQKESRFFSGYENPWQAFSPTAKVSSSKPQAFQIDRDVVVIAPDESVAAKILVKEIKKLTATTLSLKTGGVDADRRVITVESTAKIPVLPREGYSIVAEPGKVTIACSDERGCLYGAYSLLSRLKRNGAKWTIPCGKEEDWPDLETRAAFIEMLPAPMRDIDLFKRYLFALSRARANTVVFNFNPNQIDAWINKRKQEFWTESQVAELAEYARYLRLDVWAGLGSSFDRDRFPAMKIAKGAEIYNPLQESSYLTLFGLYDRLTRVIRPATFLIGHDEIKGLSLYAAGDKDRTDTLFAASVNRLSDWLSAKQMGTAMWGDMLLEDSRWMQKVGDANSMNPVFNSGATHKAISSIRKSVIIIDWHYAVKPAYPSLGYFKENGFTVMGAVWYEPVAAKNMANSLKQVHGKGIVGTDFGFLVTLSPAALTLYAQLCGWSVQCRADWNDAYALADMLRNDMGSDWDNGESRTVNLRPVCNRSTIDRYGDSNGIFGFGPGMDLRALKSGRQDIYGIPFDLVDANQGAAKNCVVVENAARRDTAEKRLPVSNQKAKAVAFLHTAFMKEPHIRLKPIGEYVVVYKDGRQIKIPLLENWNITDVRSMEGFRSNSWSFTKNPDVLIGSRLAWRGISETGLPLNAQVLLWNNPYPEEEIERIQVSAIRGAGSTKIVVLGITLLQ